MNEFSIKDFKLNTNYVIEASAGTGKTYNIIEIVGKLISNNIPLNKILIVTYTDKATQELRNRIKEKLIDIKSSEKISDAEIYTIHSFCKTIMEEFPISGNFNSNMTMIDDSQIDEFADAYIRQNDKCLDIIVNDKESKNPADDLKKKLINLTKRYYLDKDFNENTDVVSHALNEIKDEEIEEYLFLKNAKDLDEVLSDSRFDWLNEWYRQLVVSINSQKLKKDKAKYQKIIDIMSKYKDGFTITKSQKNDASEYNDCWEELKNYNDNFKNIRKKTGEIDLEFDYDLLKDFYISWIKYKEENKLIDFSDMIRSMHEECLNNNDFLNQLQNKYKYVIIDEFQDTNQLQYDIFKRIFLTDNHNMIVVGDPKQSIYSFQGTDLTVYNKAKEEICEKGGLLKSLSKNYRTSSKLVEGVNELIGYFKDKDNSFNSFNDFKESSSVNYKDDKKEFNAYLDGLPLDKPIWIATDIDDNGIKEIDEDKYSDIVVSKIVELCMLDASGKTKLQVEEKTKENETNKRNVSFKDFCILCRARSEVNTIIYKLKKYGIPYLQYKDSNLFKGRECAHFKAILEAIIISDFTGENRKVYNKALFTDFFGLDLALIHSTYSSRDDTIEMKELIKWRKLASKYDWAELIDALINDSNLRKNNSGSSNMQSLFNYLQIAQYILNSLTKDNNLDKVLKRLNDLSNSNSTDDDEDNASIVERASDFDAVKIMTMHSSKGLEFPIVISAGGLKDLRKNSDNNAYIHHENNDAIITLGRYAPDEEIEEYKRLFYVAYTRAKYLLIAPLYKELDSLDFIYDTLKEMIDAKSKYVTIITDSNCQNLHSLVSNILSKNSNTVSNPTDNDNKEQKQNLINSKSSQLTHKHSYSSLTHSNQVLDETIVEDTQEDLDEDDASEEIRRSDKEGVIDLNNELDKYDSKFKEIKPAYDTNTNPITLSDNFPRGNRIGTILHEVFEKIDFKDYRDIDQLIIECFKHEGLTHKSEWIDDVRNIVDNVLNAKLEVINGSIDMNQNFSLKELSFDSRLSEIEFNFNFKDNTIKDYCNGFVDLIFKRGEYYSVLDWKSDSLNLEEGFTSYSDYEVLKQHTSKHYAIQRVLYSYTLIKYLNEFYNGETLEDTFNKHFGGIYYVYLKGCNKNTFNGIYSQTWDSFKELEDAYKNIVKVKVDKEVNNG